MDKPVKQGKATETAFMEKMVVIGIRGLRYGISARHVTEVSRPLTITNIPCTPDYLLGVSNLRGSIISIVDAAMLLGGAPSVIIPATRIVVCRHEEMIIGVVVDFMDKILDIDELAMEQNIATLEDTKAEYVEGMFMDGEHVSPVLNVARLAERIKSDLAK